MTAALTLRERIQADLEEALRPHIGTRVTPALRRQLAEDLMGLYGSTPHVASCRHQGGARRPADEKSGS